MNRLSLIFIFILVTGCAGDTEKTIENKLDSNKRESNSRKKNILIDINGEGPTDEIRKTIHYTSPVEYMIKYNSSINKKLIMIEQSYPDDTMSGVYYFFPEYINETNKNAIGYFMYKEYIIPIKGIGYLDYNEIKHKLTKEEAINKISEVFEKVYPNIAFDKKEIEALLGFIVSGDSGKSL